MQPRGIRVLQIVKDKQGKSLIDKDEILEMWADYICIFISPIMVAQIYKTQKLITK